MSAEIGEITMHPIGMDCSLSAVITKACGNCGSSFLVDGVIQKACPGCGGEPVTQDCGVIARWKE